MKVIVVDKKKVFGFERLVPACPEAEIFSKLIGKPIFDDKAISLIKSLGYEVKERVELFSHLKLV